MLTLALRKELEEKVDSKIIFILKETHKIIAISKIFCTFEAKN